MHQRQQAGVDGISSCEDCQGEGFVVIVVGTRIALGRGSGTECCHGGAEEELDDEGYVKE